MGLPSLLLLHEDNPLCVYVHVSGAGGGSGRCRGRLVNLIFFLHSENILVLVFVTLFVISVFGKIVEIPMDGGAWWAIQSMGSLRVRHD